MRAIVQLFMYTLILLIITVSKASNDDRHSHNSLNDIKHVQHITGLVITRAIPYTIPQPYQVTVEQEVPYPVKVPVQIPVDRPYEILHKPFTVPVVRPIPYPLHRLVPYPIHEPMKHNEELATPISHIQDYRHKPLDLPNQVEYDVAASLNRAVPIRAPQPTTPPAPVTPYPPLPPPSTPEPSSNQYNFNVLETMRLPLKPAGPMTPTSFQAHRPYAGFNIGAHQFTEHLQYPPLPQAEPSHQQQQAIIIRRPVGFSLDPAIIGAYQHQPNPENEHLNELEHSDLSNEQNHDILANFAEGAVFNLNNRLRRRSSSKADTNKKSSAAQTTTTTTTKPPKKT